MKQEELVAGLDLGSSKLIAMIARKNEHGVLSILDAQRIKSENCIRRGCVYNIEDTAQKVKRLLTELNSKSEHAFDKIYVGINGQSLRSQLHVVEREVGGEMISQKLLDFLLSECSLYSPDEEGEIEVLDISSPEYYLDGRLEKNPIGIRCQKIEARYQLIIGRSSLKADLKRIIEDRIEMPIAGYFISPLATAQAVLSEDQKKLGCALVEFGGGVTTVSIYTNGFLRYLVTIPLGGEVITKDLLDMNVLEEEAETLKKKGDLEGIDIDAEKLEFIISTRCEEIVDNVVEQIKESGYLDELKGGIFITGGGAAMNDLSDYLEEKTNLQVQSVSARMNLVNQASSLSKDTANSAIIGLLALGKGDCAVPQKEEVISQPVGTLFDDNELDTKNDNEGKRKKPDKPKGSGFFSRIKKGIEDTTGDLFRDQ